MKKFDYLAFAREIFSLNPKKLNEITQEELKKRYYRLARLFHPDLHQDKREQMDKKMKKSIAPMSF